MADRSVDPLLVTRNVIGDVLDTFTPTVDFSVRYGALQVINDCCMKPSSVTNKPTVHISGDPDSTNLYTLLMTDPDAPSPAQPVLKECLHWMVINIPEGFDVTEGEEVMSYIGPNPPSGVHRFVFTLFQQKETKTVPPPEPDSPTRQKRHNFSTRTFANKNEFGLPVAAVFFNAEMDPPPVKRSSLTIGSSSRCA